METTYNQRRFSPEEVVAVADRRMEATNQLADKILEKLSVTTDGEADLGEPGQLSDLSVPEQLSEPESKYVATLTYRVKSVEMLQLEYLQRVLGTTKTGVLNQALKLLTLETLKNEELMKRVSK
jgi:hypothetical protein